MLQQRYSLSKSLKKTPELFGQKQIEAIRFWNGFLDKSAKTDCSKEMWVPILKGLKHLNTDLYTFQNM